MPAMKPIFLDDYRNARQGNPLVAFTRNSPQSFFDRLGKSRIAAANELAIGYDPVTGACLGTPNEPQSVNSFLYSNDLTNAAWAKGNVTATASAVAPLIAGTTPTDVEASTVGVITRVVRQDLSTAVAGTRVFSAIVRDKTITPGQGFALVVTDHTGTTHNVRSSYVFSTDTFSAVQVFGGAWSGVAGRTKLATGDVIFWLAVTTTSGTHTSLRANLYLGAFSGTPETVGGITVHHMQWEEGANAPSSPILTQGSAVTRAPTSQIISGPELAARYDPTKALLVFAKWRVPYANPTLNGRGLMWFNNGTNFRGIGLYYVPETSVISATQRDDSGAQIAASLPIPAAGTVCSSLFLVAPGVTRLALNGAVAQGTGTALGATTINQVHLHQSRAAGTDTGILTCDLMLAGWYCIPIAQAPSLAEMQAMSLTL